MANTLSTMNPTLLDFKSRLDPNDKIATIIELLTLQNEVLEDMTWQEGNLPTGHRTTVRTGLPSGTWRALYGGVIPTKSTTVQVTDNCGMLETYAEVDKALADLNNNTAEFRFSEETAFIAGLNKNFCDTLFYGNEGTTPAAFTGFAPRFNAISGAANGMNVLSGGGAGGASDLTDIFLVGWGPQTVHGIIPKGSVAGLQVQDKGVVTIENVGNDSNFSGRMEAYRTHYRWDCGLSVRDWRYIVRIPNIKIGSLAKSGALATGGSGADLVDLMTAAIELIPNMGLCRPVFYVPRIVRSWLRRQIANKVIGSTLTLDEVAGRHVLGFDGIPVRRCDSILTNQNVAIS